MDLCSRRRACLLCACVVHAGASAWAASPVAEDSLDKVVVSAKRPVAASDTDASAPTILTEKLTKLPGGFGDPLQAIYSLPGIVQTEDGGGEPAVRGSGPDDNRFLIDFLPASFVFHDLGNSIFNEDLVRDFGLKAAGYGAPYGGATGAVFDVSLREPRNQPLTATLNASLLQASGLIEGRLGDTQAFYLSYRESLLPILLPLIYDEEKEKEDDTYFRDYPRATDFQAKYSWTPDERNRLSIFALGARDTTAVDLGAGSEDALRDPGLTGRYSVDTRFSTAGARWAYDNGIDTWQIAAGQRLDSRKDRQGNNREFLELDLDEKTYKGQYSRALSSTYTVRIGSELQKQEYDYSVAARYRSCTAFSPDCDSDPGDFVSDARVQSVETFGGFLENTWAPSSRVSLTAGVRYTNNRYLDEKHVEPRVSFRVPLTTTLDLHGAWGKYHQMPEPEEIFPVFGNTSLRSPQATHSVLGLSQKLASGWSWTSDLYYKDLSRLVVDVDDPAIRYLNRAAGKAYGAEIMINKDRVDPADPWYGWVTLSLARTERRNEITGTTTRFDYETPVVANVVLNYRFARRWEAGARWNFRSGMPYTPIIGNTPNPAFPGYYLPVYGSLNSARASPYHRLDLRVERRFEARRIRGSYYFELINAYARTNGGSVEYKPTAGSSSYTLEEEEGLPLIPSAGIKLIF
jgi:hypothetical protein